MEQSEIEKLVESIDPVDAFILGGYDTMEREVYHVPQGAAADCYVEYAKLPADVSCRLFELAMKRMLAHAKFHLTGVRVELGEP